MTDHSHKVFERFSAIIESYFLSDSPVLDIAVAVSGGPDSMGLCVMLARWAAQNRPDLRIHALTVDHRLRSESGAEAKAVSDWLAPYKSVRHNILAWGHTENPRARVQEQARAARYDLLCDYMKKNNITALFLGHHQDDQAETFLFRLAKGSGLDGLSGMAEIQEFRDGLFLYRPLLAFSKEDLVLWCRENDISFCTDPSNSADRFARVRLRKAVDVLEAEGLSNKRLATTAFRLSRARKALEQITEKLFQESVLKMDTGMIVLKYSALRSAPEEIALRVLIMALEKVSPEKSYPARMEKVENLFADLMKPLIFRKRTLSGIIFERKDAQDKVILTLEH